VVVRNDLPPGVQVAQAVHAAVEHALAMPNITKATPVVAVLGIPDEDRLWILVEDIWASNGPYVALFYEPDFDGELTAIATVAGNRREFRRLPLLFAGGGETHDSYRD
jgi:hypothetical protein